MATSTGRHVRHAVRRLKRLRVSRARCAAAAVVAGALCLFEWTAVTHPSAPTDEEVAAIRHAARRLMFGGFTSPAELRGQSAGRQLVALLPKRRMHRQAARALARAALADDPPTLAVGGGHSLQWGAGAGAQGPATAPRRRDLDPWLPRLGPVGSAAQALGLESFYSRWIVADLSVWGQSGISKVILRTAMPHSGVMLRSLERPTFGSAINGNRSALATRTSFMPGACFAVDQRWTSSHLLNMTIAEACEQGAAAGAGVPRVGRAVSDRQRQPVDPP